MKYWILALALVIAINGINLHHADSSFADLKTGGYTSHPPGPGDKPVDTFIKAQIPELADANFTAASTQVVNGFNHRFTYEKNGNTWTITVYEDMDGNYQLMGVKQQNNSVTQETKLESRDLVTVARNLFNTHKWMKMDL